MKRLFKLLSVILVLSSMSCVPSLHQLFTKDSLTFDEALIGSWKEDDNIWKFEKESDSRYKMTMTDAEGKSGEFETHLVKIGDHLYLDLYPLEPELRENDFYKMHLIPSHTFMWVKQIEPQLELSPMGPQAIQRLIEKHPDAVKHEIVKDTVVLTASPKELQGFVKKYHNHLFDEPGELERIK